MKLTLAIVLYLLIGLVLGWGILHLLKGSYWPLLVGLGLYVLAFARFGCTEH